MLNGSFNSYVQAAIEGERRRLAAAVVGERNDTLFKSSAALASLGLGEGEILRNLKPVAETIGLKGSELYSTVKSGVKCGRENPRRAPSEQCPSVKGVPSAAERSDRAFNVLGELPQRTGPDPLGKPAFQVGGEEGPRISNDEVRRHVYRRNGRSVRVKIKRTSGSYVNWYRVACADGEGWQAAKPDGFKPCPYVGSLDAFDPELVDQPLCWPEGEKDCDTLANASLCAFTFGGTGDGLFEGVSDYLAARDVIILADNDPGGRSHAAKKAALAHGVAKSVKVIEFLELPEKGDVSDYLAVASVADLEKRVADAPLWRPPAPPAAATVTNWRNSVITASELRLKSFRPVQYVVPGFIPEGVTIFAGKPKLGKSWLLLDVCLGSAADRFVLGEIKPVQGDVLYLALEDSERRLQGRLNKLWPGGNWPGRLTLTTQWQRADEGGVAAIADWCDSVQKPTLVAIDTLEKFRPQGRPSQSAYSGDYQATADIHKLAHERGIAVVLAHHVRKMEADDPFDMVSGTNGLTGAADTVLVLKRQGGKVTLFSRGRDVEERETACEFNKNSCRWTLLGDAADFHESAERAQIREVLERAGEQGMHISEIMLATGRRDRNAIDQMLYKMARDGEAIRPKRGMYAAASKIGKK